MIAGLLLAVAVVTQNPDSLRAEYARRIRIQMQAYQMGRACQRYGGRDPEAAARDLAQRFPQDSAAQEIARQACRSALTGGSYTWTPPPPPPAPEPPKVFAPALPGPFGTYNWVFWSDVLLSAGLGLIVGYIHARRRSSMRTAGWVALGGVVGALGGVAVFLPFMMMSLFFMFLAPVGGAELFALTAIVIVGGFVGAALGSPFGKGRPTWLNARRWTR